MEIGGGLPDEWIYDDTHVPLNQRLQDVPAQHQWPGTISQGFPSGVQPSTWAAKPVATIKMMAMVNSKRA